MLSCYSKAIAMVDQQILYNSCQQRLTMATGIMFDAPFGQLLFTRCDYTLDAVSI
jgi:hypothetical protein